MANPRAFFDLSIEDERLGRVVFELFAKVVPKTCENFLALATGERGISSISQFPLSYKGSIIHRSIPGFMIQGGDFTKKNGSGGESIYGGTFEDENFDMDVDAEGLLVMANRGPNTNGSQFFITLRSCPHLNGKHVVFGRVVTGYDIVMKIAEEPTDSRDRPLRPIIISGAGELVPRGKIAPQRAPGSPVGPRQSTKRIRSRSSSASLSSSQSRPPPRSRSRSPPSGDRDRHRQFERRSRSRSGSREQGNRSSGHDKPHRSSKKSKRLRRGDDSRDRDREASARSSKAPREETEAELDARLEREEEEQIAEARRKEAEALRNSLKYSRRQEASSGVRFKGRGIMRYKDPELSRR